ncbi:hypothetical protein Hamer_G024356, partial [Homarus americanus]
MNQECDHYSYVANTLFFSALTGWIRHKGPRDVTIVNIAADQYLRLDKVAVDLVPISPPSSQGNRWILTLVDYATRWPEAVAIPGIETKRVAEALLVYTPSLASLLDALDVAYHFYVYDTQLYVKIINVQDIEEIINH